VFGFASGFLLSVVPRVIVLIASPQEFSKPDVIIVLVKTGIGYLVLLPIPLAIGIAVLRYHLWDIDAIINRTLVYGSLTALLAVVYFGGVYGAQALLNALLPAQAGRQSPVIIVASTLLIAALFTPLRRRLQSTVDRRFYRRKYDAARTLARFSMTLRSEVNLDGLRTQLVGVVDETMQPVHVSLWLREPAARLLPAGGAAALRREPPPKGGDA
jgi:hypothetical protein